MVLSNESPWRANLTAHSLVLWESVSPADDATALLTVVKPARQGQGQTHQCLSKHHLTWLSIFNQTNIDPTCSSAAPCLSAPESSLWSLAPWSRRKLQLPQRSSHTWETSPTGRSHLMIKNTVHSLLAVTSQENHAGKYNHRFECELIHHWTSLCRVIRLSYFTGSRVSFLKGYSEISRVLPRSNIFVLS